MSQSAYLSYAEISMSNPARPAIGSPAPQLELATAAGETWRLADQRGTYVVLIFHRHIH